MSGRLQRIAVALLALVVWLGCVRISGAQQSAPAPAAAAPGPAAAPAAKPAAPGAGAPATPSNEPFFLHAYHMKTVGLECDTCHVPQKEGSVVLQRPGHDQCTPCHEEAFNEKLNPKICAQCHSDFPPTSSDGLFPYPRFKGQRSLLIDFAHSRHVDPQGRNDSRTGFRADCAFCHSFDAQGLYAKFPTHAQCTSCHAKPGFKPVLSAKSTTADCRGCHAPEEIENPDSATHHAELSAQVLTGTYAGIRFSHVAHNKVRDEYHVNCTTCHSDVLKSTGLADLTLPKMIDCVGCHDTSKSIPAQYSMSNCNVCHVDVKNGPMPPSHSRYVKPAFHDESFRQHHSEQASEANAKCFVCHTNVSPSATVKQQCVSCHEVSRPISHTMRWNDDIHGKYAAIDRVSCALCHQADYCSRCHNQLPRSHQPLPQFKNGGHANLAMLNTRACFTCHTFETPCAECHVEQLQRGTVKK